MISLIKNKELTLLTDEPVIAAADVLHVETLSDAGTQFAEMLEKLQTQVEQAEKKGFEKGFEFGRIKGQEKAAEEASQHLLMLTQQAADQKLVLQSSVAQLALQVVSKIAESIGAADTVAAIAETASRDLIVDEALTVYVHPSVLVSVEQRFQQMQDNSDDMRYRVEIRGDDNLKDFDCLLETEFGTTVASLDQQLACLEKVLQPTSMSLENGGLA